MALVYRVAARWASLPLCPLRGEVNAYLAALREVVVGLLRQAGWTNIAPALRSHLAVLRVDA